MLLHKYFHKYLTCQVKNYQPLSSFTRSIFCFEDRRTYGAISYNPFKGFKEEKSLYPHVEQLPFRKKQRHRQSL